MEVDFLLGINIWGLRSEWVKNPYQIELRWVQIYDANRKLPSIPHNKNLGEKYTILITSVFEIYVIFSSKRPALPHLINVIKQYITWIHKDAGFKFNLKWPKIIYFACLISIFFLTAPKWIPTCLGIHNRTN